MKRLHVHVHVGDLDQSIRFYATLFGAQPTKVEPGYAKWMLEDPRVNFAISTGGQIGLSHLGIQAETNDELAQVAARAKEAGDSVLIEENASCCYAKSNKAWVDDPAGLRWETFYTFGDITTYGQSADNRRIETKSGESIAMPLAQANTCCGPQQQPTTEKASSCCA